MLTKTKEFVKENQKDLSLFIVVFLIASLSFAFGYITAMREQRSPIYIEEVGDYSIE